MLFDFKNVFPVGHVSFNIFNDSLMYGVNFENRSQTGRVLQTANEDNANMPVKFNVKNNYWGLIKGSLPSSEIMSSRPIS